MTVLQTRAWLQIGRTVPRLAPRLRGAVLMMVVASLFPFRAAANVSFTTGVFADNMVLQRGMTVPIWGAADPGEQVTVRVAGQTQSATADALGNWVVYLDPLTAGGPYNLTVTGNNVLALANVVVGEVWLCSGQSNMVIQPPDPALLDQYAGVRAFVKHGWQDRPAGTAFWFGVALNQALGVPIGLLNQAVSSTTIRGWLGPGAGSDPDPQVQAIVGGSNQPGSYYERRIAPLQSYAIRGVIWWQGEQDVQAPVRYQHLLPALIRSWRDAWGQGDVPFISLQLPTGGGLRKDQSPSLLPDVPPPYDRYPIMRDAYMQSLQVPNTAMVITLDLRGSKHPRDKEGYGRRFAQVALGSVYQAGTTYSGPIYESKSREGSRVRLRFRLHTADGLYALGGGAPQGFSIAGLDGQFVWAQAEIQGSEVVVWNDDVTMPYSVRYAWANSPTWANLFNVADLGAGPFSDSFPVPTQTGAHTATWTPTPSATRTRTSTRTITPTATVTPTPSITPTITLTPVFSFTPSLTPTPTTTATRTRTLTPTLTQTPTITDTPLPGPVCTSGIPITHAKLKIANNLLPGGDETVHATGFVELPTNVVPDPATTGLSIGVTDAGGGLLFLRVVSGGAGWRVLGNRTRTWWLYRDPTGSQGGITEVTVFRAAQSPVLKVWVSGARADFRIPDSVLPVQVALILGPPYVATSPCAAQTLNRFGESPPTCKSSVSGSLLACR